MIFTPAELVELATPPGDRAVAALDAADRETARAIAVESLNAHFVLRDLYSTWNVLTIAYLQEELGTGTTEECLASSLRNLLHPIIDRFRNGADREVVWHLAQLLRMDAGELTEVREDSESVVLTARGWIGARTAALQLPGLPDLWAGTAEIEKLCVDMLGYPPFVLTPGTRDDELLLVVYKSPRHVPAQVYSRLGVDPDPLRMARAFETDGADLLDDTDLAELPHQAFVLAVRALDSGDDRAARRHLVRSKTEWLPMHDLLRDWGTQMHNWLTVRFGADATWRCWDVVYNGQVLRPMLGQVGGLDLRTQVQLMAGMFHQHGMRFDIVETVGGFDFRTRSCGSGGRLIARDSGTGPTELTLVPGPSVRSFGADELPVYCMHCPATNRMLLEQGGPYFLLVDPDIHDGHVRGHCSFHIFKNAHAVPDSMYQRVGLPAPAQPNIRRPASTHQV